MAENRVFFLSFTPEDGFHNLVAFLYNSQRPFFGLFHKPASAADVRDVLKGHTVSLSVDPSTIIAVAKAVCSVTQTVCPNISKL